MIFPVSLAFARNQVPVSWNSKMQKFKQAVLKTAKKLTPTAGSAMDCEVLHALFLKMVQALIIQLTKDLEKQLN